MQMAESEARKNRTVCLCALAALILTACTTVRRAPAPQPGPHSGASRSDGQKLSVIVADATRAPSLEGNEWDDLRVGMGIASMLAQALHDTGLFALRETTPEIRARLAQTWRTSPCKTAPVLDTSWDYAASVRLERFFVKDRSIFLGFGGAGRRQTHIDVSVQLTDTSSGRSYETTGRGTAETGTSGVLFLYESGTVAFDETTIGKATREAIHDAVSRITIP